MDELLDEIKVILETYFVDVANVDRISVVRSKVKNNIIYVSVFFIDPITKELVETTKDSIWLSKHFQYVRLGILWIAGNSRIISLQLNMQDIINQ